jgi:hypothetical protein
MAKANPFRGVMREFFDIKDSSIGSLMSAINHFLSLTVCDNWTSRRRLGTGGII